MTHTLLSPYSKIFYNEWKVDKNRSDYNIVFDQTLEGELNTKKLEQTIVRFISDYLLFNSHVVENQEGNLCWGKNDRIFKLEYLRNKG